MRRPRRRLPLALLTLLAACIDTRASERDALDASTLDAGSDSGKSDGGNDNPDASSDAQTPDASACGTCPSATPVCLEDTKTCVPCAKDKPGACKGDTSLCREQTNTCVQCLNHGDCTEGSAARCDDGACVPCTDNAECAHIPGMHACVEGACVECTRELKSACERDGVQYVCNANTHACDFARTVGSKELCGECVSNDECKEGDACVEVPASGASGVRVCQRVRTDAACPRPYVEVTAAIASADGLELPVCTLRPSTQTTCQAHRDYSNKRCGQPNPAFPDGPDRDMLPEQDFPDTGNDELCGVEGLDDGYCVWFPGVTQFRCTVPCNNDPLDCPASAMAATCTTVGDRTYCSL